MTDAALGFLALIAVVVVGFVTWLVVTNPPPCDGAYTGRQHYKGDVIECYRGDVIKVYHHSR